MTLTTQRTFTLTLTENEVSVITRFLDDVCMVGEIIVPDTVKKLHNSLNAELMEVH